MNKCDSCEEMQMVLYHGSQQIVAVPKYGVGKMHNDYGQGFYCTKDIELAKEWACAIPNNGFANKYRFDISELNVMHLSMGEYSILNWLAVLLKNRNFDISSPIGHAAREFILSRFLPRMDGVDVMIGYRADDSYFSFAEDFLNNIISLRDLNMAMHLGLLGEQVVLLSERSYQKIEFLGEEVADHHEYYLKRQTRDRTARATYANRKKNLQAVVNDFYVLDIIREDMKDGDSRLQSDLSF